MDENASASVIPQKHVDVTCTYTNSNGEIIVHHLDVIVNNEKQYQEFNTALGRTP